jgi:mono/diheme cytochrome c family protein
MSDEDIMNPQTKPSPLSSRRFVRQTASLLAALLVVGAAAVSIGVPSYDVSAVTPHSAPVEWALRHGMKTSVRAHAAGIIIPAGTDLQDPRLAERAIGHYSVACAQCHAAPGHPAAPWMVLYPAPADLTRPEVVARWSDTELYWIIKNGIKDTGMIALGPTHQEQDLWAVSAFVRQLPEMSSERYHELVTQYQAQLATMAAAPAHPH